MRSPRISLFTLTIVVLVFYIFAPTSSFGQTPGWQIYDDFNSGKIDTEKWDIDDSSAAISVENGHAKFVLNPAKPDDSSWLKFKKWPEKIKAIRAKVKLQNNSSEFYKGRIGGFFGKNAAGNHVWLEMNLHNATDAVQGYAEVYNDSTYSQDLYPLFSFKVDKPDGITGKWYTLELHFDLTRLEFKGNAVKEISHRLIEPLNPPDVIQKGLGTRRWSPKLGQCGKL
jgi:hypothetical protein